ncbi:MAG: dihydropteroate synthase [Peptococcaceae bacterium]|nr:dihydropteroate synthase [Peptococcaceae bacterium]
MTSKAVHRAIKISGLTPKQANIIKQEMLSRGGETAVARGVIDCSQDSSSVLVLGTVKQIESMIAKLKIQPFGLSAVANQLTDVLDNIEGRKPFELKCRDKTLIFGRKTLIMGILNITPDSFSDGGSYIDPGKAVEQAFQLQEDGADIIDIGAESTRPGHKLVDWEEETRRLLPVLSSLVRKLDIPISVDTTKASVAERMLAEGAHMVNDQWGLQGDREMAEVVSRYQAPVIVMHNQKNNIYPDLMGDMIDFFRKSISLAQNAGIKRDAVIIDPGIGFAKSPEQNIQVLKRLEELSCLGLPVLLGTSRKSTIGKILDLSVDQRMEGTAATVALGIASGVDIVRVHDVREMARVAKMSDAIIRF